MNSRNTTKTEEHKLVLFATVIALWTLVTLLIELIRLLLKWKYIQDQNYVVRAKLFCLKRVSSRSPGWSAHMKNFHPGYRDLGRKNRDLGNRDSLASHMNTSIFLQRKEWPGEISETEPARSTGLIYI